MASINIMVSLYIFIVLWSNAEHLKAFGAIVVALNPLRKLFKYRNYRSISLLMMGAGVVVVLGAVVFFCSRIFLSV